VNHRALQRALFRMQLDPGFAARLRAGDPVACASTRLDAEELAGLRAADPAAIGADRDGKRLEQLLGNVGSEFALSCALAGRDWRNAFTASELFHRAIAEDGSLPLAFAAYLEATAPRAAAAVSPLECAMARARRMQRPGARAPLAGDLALAATAWRVELPAGAFEFASALRAALDAGARIPRPPRFAADTPREWVLVAAGDPERSYGLRPLRVEPLATDVAAFLSCTESGVDAGACSAFAAERGIDPAELESVVKTFVAEGVLLRG
jgi:hypothetical protein